MNTHSTRLLLACTTLALALSGAGCRFLKKKGQPAPSETAPVVVAPVAPPATTVAPVAVAPPEPTVNVTDEAIPTAEDFEDEAIEKVSDTTYKAELDTLKKEIEAAP
jgi:hypothetical protein